MSRVFPASLLFAAVLLLAATGSAHAQENVDNVNILTVDGVKLRGQFYPATNKCLATVIMLHSIGEGKSMKAPEWQSLAKSLQKNGCSVLMFDFRGHGDSTEIASPKDFWSLMPNAKYVKTKNKEEIDVKDFIKQGAYYLPVLCNDIAAARAYLERRNDNSKDCNTSTIVVIGADTGATLGAIWMNSEWNRYKIVPNANNPLRPELAKTPEGKDIIGAVFLSISPSLDKQRKVSVGAVLKNACRENGSGAYFLAGKDDIKYAETLVKNLKLKSKKHEYIGAAELPTDLSGMKLLTKSLGAEGAIGKYLDGLIDDRKSDWAEREFDKSSYVWRTPGSAQPFAAKKKGEKTLLFDDYNKFIPQQ